jgi:hypothetical protein
MSECDLRALVHGCFSPPCSPIRPDSQPTHAVLTFQVSSHTEPAPNQSQKATDETFPSVVTLGHQFLSTEAKGTQTIYDFERNRIRQIGSRKQDFR